MVEKKRIVGDWLRYSLARRMELWGDMSTRYVVRVRYVGMNEWMPPRCTRVKRRMFPEEFVGVLVGR